MAVPRPPNIGRLTCLSLMATPWGGWKFPEERFVTKKDTVVRRAMTEVDRLARRDPSSGAEYIRRRDETLTEVDRLARRDPSSGADYIRRRDETFSAIRR